MTYTVYNLKVSDPMHVKKSLSMPVCTCDLFLAYIHYDMHRTVMSFSLRLFLLVQLLSVLTRYSCDTFHIVPVNYTEGCEVESCYDLNQITDEIKN